MNRNHIHIAQGIPGKGVISGMHTCILLTFHLSYVYLSGMRNTSQIFIFINVQKAIDEGIKFYLSENGVILTEGNNAGILSTEFFLRVEDATSVALPGWEGTAAAASS